MASRKTSTTTESATATATKDGKEQTNLIADVVPADRKPRRGPTPQPWNTRVEEDPDVFGRKEGEKVFYCFINGPKKKRLIEKLIRADSKFEANAYYRGDGMRGEADVQVFDVTDRYKADFAKKSGPEQPDATSEFSDMANAFQFHDEAE